MKYKEKEPGFIHPIVKKNDIISIYIYDISFYIRDLFIIISIIQVQRTCQGFSIFGPMQLHDTYICNSKKG
jgi:hypothetical protein